MMFEKRYFFYSKQINKKWIDWPPNYESIAQNLRRKGKDLHEGVWGKAGMLKYSKISLDSSSRREISHEQFVPIMPPQIRYMRK